MNKINLTVEERVFLWRKCKQLGIDLEGITVYRSKDLSWKGAVACFDLKTPNYIYVCNDQPNWISLIPHIAHEFIHLNQYKDMGWRYVLSAIPGIRNFTIEPPAYAFEDKIREQLG